jgi:hypothetical protein
MNVIDDPCLIKVTVTLYPPLRENRFSKAAVDIVAPATIGSLLQHLDIKKTDVESVYIDGREGTFKQVLKGGERVVFLPLIGGG